MLTVNIERMFTLIGENVVKVDALTTEINNLGAELNKLKERKVKAIIKDIALQKDGTYGVTVVPETDTFRPFTVYIGVDILKNTDGEFLNKAAMLAAVQVEVAKVAVKSEFSPAQLIGAEVDTFDGK